MTTSGAAVQRDPGARARAVLVGVELKGKAGNWTLQDSLDELARLAETAGLQVAESTYQKLAHPDPRTWIGSGKVREIGEILAATGAGYVLFDDELAPGQQRNLEKALGAEVRVIDRTRLILDIFSQHARSREGKLQVELAQYQYLLPRLAGLRTGLAQQTGGTGAGAVGLRGPGETQLELDRRQARRRIASLRKELEGVRLQRGQHRARRDRVGVPVIALVGYTNAGKSSLLNALTGAGVLVQDKLFATLDPTTRRLELPGGRDALLTDTVGFIRKIPHDLVAAFRATLEGIEEADLVVHVVDSSHPRPAELVSAVDEVLSSLELTGTPRLLVWNKADLVTDGGGLLVHGLHEHALAVSARTGKGLPELLSRFEALLSEGLRVITLEIPWERYDAVNLVYGQGTVLSRTDGPEGITLRARVPAALERQLESFGRGTPSTS
ncbi:MAG TPA: GTPase HflX [Spirochaetia bacterium]|nr:GTPase HflX [Spirochaetia bacterium]